MSKERLTYVDENGEVLFHAEDFPEDEGLTITQLAEDGRYKALEEIAGRLTNREQYCELLEKELKQYRDLEEQGLLLRLPVAVGDTVYSFTFGKVFSAEVVEIKYLCEAENYGKFTRRRITIDGGDECGIAIIDFSDIGEKVFLTQAEAEEKLKSLNNENDIER